MEVYVVDSHALLWFMTRSPKLSPVARQILKQAEMGEVMAFVPTIVLAELDNIVRKKNLEITIEEILDRIEIGDGLAITAFDLTVFQTMLTLPQNWEIHDRIIAATAVYAEAKLITRDEVLGNADEIETVWD
ncbi:MAG: PIN domain-containing protein [Hormoscilla sp. GM7CHS1pb]|nr:PIN domain-containing protein [Hormoscilla sp. GM7CHS1pb]